MIRRKLQGELRAGVETVQRAAFDAVVDWLVAETAR
jgi:hypothetical protein